MKKSLPTYFFAVIGFFLMMSSACESGNDSKTIATRINPVLTRADGFIVTNPDSAILLTDYVLRITEQSDKLDSAYLAAQYIKAQAIRQKGYYDKAYDHLKELITFAQSIKDTSAVAQLKYKLGYWYYFDNQYFLAKEYLGQSNDAFSGLGNRAMQADAALYMGISDLNLGNFETAERSLSRSLKFFSQTQDAYKMGLCYMNIGNLRHELKDNEGALNYYLQSVSEFQRSNDSALLASVFVNIGLVYKTKNLDSALYYYKISDNFNANKSAVITQIINTYNIADIYVLQNKFDDAISNLDWCLAKCIENNIGDGIPRILSCYASIYVKTKNLPKALLFIDSAMVLTDSLKLLPVKVKILEQKINILDSLGRKNEMLVLQKQHDVLKDSLKYKELQNKLKEDNKIKATLNQSKENKYIKKKSNDFFSQFKLGLLLVVSLILIVVFYFYTRTSNTQ